MLYKYLPGIQLNKLLSSTSRLSLTEVTFFTAGMVVILSYLRSKKIIHRDLKPESFKITYDGYLKLVKLGAAKININANTNMVCKTILGTPHYMAPEIISQKPYNFHVDLWSLGIIVYEMICGVVPFAEGEEDPYEIYHTILGKEKLQFPPIFKKDNYLPAKSLIEQLLNRNPEERIGREEFLGLKNHDFFHNFDFEDFENKEMVPPSKDWVDLRKEEDLVKKKLELVQGLGGMFNKVAKSNIESKKRIHTIGDGSKEDIAVNFFKKNLYLIF